MNSDFAGNSSSDNIKLIYSEWLPLITNNILFKSALYLY